MARRVELLLFLSALVLSCGEPARAPDAERETEPVVVVVPTAVTAPPAEASSSASAPRPEPNSPAEVSGDDTKHGATANPLKPRVARLYARLLRHHLQHGFRCTQPSACSATGLVEMDDTGTITSAQLTPCGDATLDAAASAHLKRQVGKTLPPPPSAYPELRVHKLTVRFRCK